MVFRSRHFGGDGSHSSLSLLELNKGLFGIWFSRGGIAYTSYNRLENSTYPSAGGLSGSSDVS